MSLHFNDNTSQCRYSPHLINIIMALCMKSNIAYTTLRQSGLIKLPHAKTLQKLQKPLKVTEGFDPNVYLTMKNITSKSDKSN